MKITKELVNELVALIPQNVYWHRDWVEINEGILSHRSDIDYNRLLVCYFVDNERDFEVVELAAYIVIMDALVKRDRDINKFFTKDEVKIMYNRMLDSIPNE